MAAAAEVGTCPLHSHDRYRALYDKLVETARAQAVPDEESDMEASDVEDETPNVNSDSIPLGTTFRTIHLIQPPAAEQEPPEDPPPVRFMPRKLSTISSQDRESIPNIDEDEEAVPEEATIEAEVHANKPPHDPLKTTDFEWHPDLEDLEEEEEEQEARALLHSESRYRNTDL